MFKTIVYLTFFINVYSNITHWDAFSDRNNNIYSEDNQCLRCDSNVYEDFGSCNSLNTPSCPVTASVNMWSKQLVTNVYNAAINNKSISAALGVPSSAFTAMTTIYSNLTTVPAVTVRAGTTDDLIINPYLCGGSTNISCCPVGTYDSTGTGKNCIACPAGRYSSSVSVKSCLACVPGSYSGATAQTSSATCAACPAGTYSNVYGSLTCKSCPAGTYVSSGSTYCSFCSAGTYSTGSSAVTGSAACVGCANNKAVGEQLCDAVMCKLPSTLVCPVPAATTAAQESWACANNVTCLNANTFANFPAAWQANLTTIDIANNNLTWINSDLFSGIPNLQLVDVRNNSLTGSSFANHQFFTKNPVVILSTK